MSEAVKKTAAINFRVAGPFREKVDGLAADSGWSVSDNVSLGLLAFWPEIEALVRVSGSQPPGKLNDLREFIALCRNAQSRGVDPKKALTDALEAHLSNEAGQPASA